MIKNFNEYINESSHSDIKYKMSKTYETWDEESIEHGETDDRGFEYENQEFDSIWDMAKEIRDNGASEPSSSINDVNTSYITPDSYKNHRNDKETYYSFHPKLKNDQEAKELYNLVKMDRKQFNDAEPNLD